MYERGSICNDNMSINRKVLYILNAKNLAPLSISIFFLVQN